MLLAHSQEEASIYVPDPEIILCMQLHKVFHTMIRYRIASTKVLLVAAQLLTKVSTDCEVCKYHSISQL